MTVQFWAVFLMDVLSKNMIFFIKLNSNKGLLIGIEKVTEFLMI